MPIAVSEQIPMKPEITNLLLQYIHRLDEEGPVLLARSILVEHTILDRFGLPISSGALASRLRLIQEKIQSGALKAPDAPIAEHHETPSSSGFTTKGKRKR